MEQPQADAGQEGLIIFDFRVPTLVLEEHAMAYVPLFKDLATGT